MVLKNTGKSGLSPILPLPSTPGSPRTTRIRKWRHEGLIRHQKLRFMGFLASELHSLQALAPLDVSPGEMTLNNQIHPFFRKERWADEADLPKNQGPIPLLGDHDGFWLVRQSYPCDFL